MIMMNYLFPVAAAGGALALLLPPLFAKLAPLPPSSQSAFRCEGYYPDAAVCLTLGPGRPSPLRLRRDNARCPQWQLRPAWAGREALARRLGEAEDAARRWEEALAAAAAEDAARCGGVDDSASAARPPVRLRRERGMAWSRVEAGVMAGNSEFHRDGADGRKHVCWTDALLPLYVTKYGLRPSQEFEAFVLAFDIEKFRAGLDALRACISRGSDMNDANDKREVGKADAAN